MLTLSEAEIAEVLTYPVLITAMEEALIAFSCGEVIQPVRTMLTIEETRRYFGIMPAVAGGAMGAKLVSFYPGNAGSSEPTHFAMILLFETGHGRPLAVLEGTLITEMRTAAVSAAVTKRLAPANPGKLALLGCGVQAKAHLEALRTLYAFDEICVWSRTPDHAAQFASVHGVRASGIEAAVRDADILVIATHAQTPILEGRWLKQGAHVNAIGAPRPAWRELDDEAMRQTLVVDSREAVLKESGDVILSGAPIFAEAGEIIAGRKTIAETSTTIFKSVGMAIEDIAAANLVYRLGKARQENA
jgi:ornithine cyclodeaminase/alanine dehydrogenase-like protein (mu-crystallin family)